MKILRLEKFEIPKFSKIYSKNDEKFDLFFPNEKESVLRYTILHESGKMQNFLLRSTLSKQSSAL